LDVRSQPGTTIITAASTWLSLVCVRTCSGWWAVVEQKKQTQYQRSMLR
jgi:hypothetical protein